MVNNIIIYVHCEISTLASIQASVIQGSGLGPASYLVTAADIRPVSGGNCIIKFADDTYLIVPAENCGTSVAELAHIEDWAEKNNLRLNCTKTKEIVFRAKGKRGSSALIPAPLLLLLLLLLKM